MSYVVYADILLLWIFVINYLTYYAACAIFGEKPSHIKLIAWSLVSSTILDFIYISTITYDKLAQCCIYICLNLLLVLSFVRFILKLKSTKGYIRLIIYNILGTIILAGIIQLFIRDRITFTIIMPVIIIICTFLPMIHILSTRDRRHMQNLTNVTIATKNITVHNKGYMDTGNSLIDSITGEPIIIIDPSLLKELVNASEYSKINEYIEFGNYEALAKLSIDEEHIYPVPYKTISNEFALMPAFKIKYLIINNEKMYKNIVAAISQTSFPKSSEYKVLLNNNL
ncbi:MAG: sigma-E processing peptidase SpoIIGA [Lachnospiraceae bacterium]|nr:sigma-E processing peptidase SpoIIGA [Lachnospiraceae bacterium]